MSKMVAIGDFLTEKQIKQAAACKSAKEICEKVIGPNMVTINEKLEQENDPMFLAYAVEYTFRQTGVWSPA